MKKNVEQRSPRTASGQPAPQVPATRQLSPTEPKEVQSRHKNSGQKDHKGAR